ncbi:MAG: RNA degradosome polyphosphate kinase, partial [Alphaproteobacteria bacterium]
MARVVSTKGSVVDLSSPDRFINRELSWLAFNTRVLEEAGNVRHPLLERLRFLSISAANLDEFFMVRVAGLKGQIAAGVTSLSDEGRTPAQQIVAVNAEVRKLVEEQNARWLALKEEMKAEGIFVMSAEDLGDGDHDWLDAFFMDMVFPVLTPLAIDPAHPFPFLPNLGFALVMHLRRRDDSEAMRALVPIPGQIGRFVRMPGRPQRYLPLEDMLSLYYDRLFPGFKVERCGHFRVIRDSEMEVEEEAEDLVRSFETALKRRRRGNVIRLSLNLAMPDELSAMVRDELDVAPEDVFNGEVFVGLAETKQLI